MAAWTTLPSDLLLSIAEALETQIDYLRFRSVCPLWRSLALPKPGCQLGDVAVSDNTSSSCSSNYVITKRTIYLIELPGSVHQWFVKVEEDANGRMSLFHPLCNSVFKSLPPNFPKKIDLLNLRVHQLGHEYVRQYKTNYISSTGTCKFLHMGKVSYMSLNNEYFLLGPSPSGGLSMFNSSDRQWICIGDQRLLYDDVINFRGKFYAFSKKGITSIVDPVSSKLVSLDPPLQCSDETEKKFLVESDGHLLLVNMYVSAWVRQYWDFKPIDNNNIFNFTLYKLNDQEWEPMKSLGDRVLFLSDYSTFSASGSVLSGIKTNCIIFRYYAFADEQYDSDESCASSTYVFDLEDDDIKSAKENVQCSKLLWPPPHWVYSTVK